MKPGKRPRRGEIRRATETEPAIIETDAGPVLVYRLTNGRVGIMHPPGTKVVRQTSRGKPRLS